MFGFKDALNEYNNLDPELKKVERRSIPAGEYNLKILEVNQKTFKECSGLSIKYQISGGQFNGSWVWEDELYKGAAPKAKAIRLSNIFNIIRACGYAPETFDESKDILIGKTVAGTVTYDKVNGKEYNGVKRVHALENVKGSKTTTPNANVSSQSDDEMDWTV